MYKQTPVSIHIAVDNAYGIGKDGKLPWHFPEDMKWFRKNTLGKAIIMGWTTWESIGHNPLKNRLNIVVTSKDLESRDNTVFVKNIKDALEAVDNSEYKEAVFIGGERLLNTLMVSDVIVDRLYLTQIKGDYDCDRFFRFAGRFPSLTDLKVYDSPEASTCVFCIATDPIRADRFSETTPV